MRIPTFGSDRPWHPKGTSKNRGAGAAHGRAFICGGSWWFGHTRGGWETRTCRIWIAWTNCHLGGERPWFLCPTHGCRRRVAILYGSAKFACRQCFELAYPSQREKPENRAIHQADRIRDKLNWKPGIANGRGSKPKGMHRRTFERLTAQHDALVQTALTGMTMRFRMLEGPIDDIP